MYKKLAVALALLGLTLFAHRLQSGKPEVPLQPATARAPVERDQKTEGRDGESLSLDGGASRKIESALERSSNEEALEGFRELVQASMENRKEVLALLREIAPADYRQDPRFLKLDDHTRELNGRMNVARAALKEHGVDREAVEAIFEEARQQASRSLGILELETEQLKRQSDGRR